MIYECHITFKRDDAAKIKEALETCFEPAFLPWKYSQIDGDPVLGREVFFYLTTHGNDIERILTKMHGTVALLRSDYGVQAVREKIELIIHDKRYTQDKEVVAYKWLGEAWKP